MPSLIDVLKSKNPLTSRANTLGKDPEPIGFENRFTPSRNLSKNAAALKQGRKGDLGQGTPRGYAPGKNYTKTTRK